MSHPALSDWWRTFFSRRGFPLAQLTRARDTDAEVRELVRLLPVRRGARILDVACGMGRHSLRLAARGFCVTGVDYSAHYLAEARRLARRSRLEVDFRKGDMRRMPFAGEFDAAINLWTSFGYFPRLSDDLRALRSIRRALKPGGWLALEVIDGARFADGADVPRQRFGREGKLWVLEELDHQGGRDPAVISERIFIEADGRVRQGTTFVRLYTRARLKAALLRAGFDRVLFSGGLIERRGQPGRPGPEPGPPRRILALARNGPERRKG